MTRFILDTGIAGLDLDRKRGLVQRDRQIPEGAG